MGSKGIERKLEIGRALSAMSMGMSQVVSTMVRMAEHAARQEEVLQQSVQNTQKSLSDEVGAKDSADAALLQKFMDTMRSGMEKGVTEAREILQGLGVLGGDIAANIDKTHALLTKGYADFEAAQTASPQQSTIS